MKTFTYLEWQGHQAVAMDQWHGVHFGDVDEAAAFVAALSRFLNYPQGRAYLQPPTSAEVWSHWASDGAAPAIYLNGGALNAVTAAFGAPPISALVPSLPSACRCLTSHQSVPSWGMDEALRQLSA